MEVLAKTNQSEYKSFLHDICMNVIKELQHHQVQIMEIYKKNSTFQFDFYNISLKEVDAKIQAIREFYKLITDEELI